MLGIAPGGAASSVQSTGHRRGRPGALRNALTVIGPEALAPRFLTRAKTKAGALTRGRATWSAGVPGVATFRTQTSVASS